VRVRFWGTRGSIPVALTWRDVRDRVVRALVQANGHALDTEEKAYAFAEQHLDPALTHTFGGHSACVEFEPHGSADAERFFVCDMGSGARAFGEHIMARQSGRPATVNVFMSHVHWDHIMGFPFFRPAYQSAFHIRIHGCHETLEHAFRLQQAPPCFPVAFSHLTARIEFVHLPPGESREIDGVRVTAQKQLHSGDSYGYRFEADARSLVYTTDSEHKLDNRADTQSFVGFFRDADLVVFDAMYSLADAVSVKADWGHSSNVVGVELCQLARAKRLALYHHEPANDDHAIARILRETRRLEELTRDGHAIQILAAYDGLEIDL
jgi:phosphoribosyl 1,2-cyclic phosphodiesterase